MQNLYKTTVILNLFQYLNLCVQKSLRALRTSLCPLRLKKIRVNPLNLCHPCSKTFALANKKQPNE